MYNTIVIYKFTGGAIFADCRMKRIVKPFLLMLLVLSMLLGFVACNTAGDGGMHIITPSNGITPDIEGVSPDRIPESQAGANEETSTPVDTTTPSMTETPASTPTPTPTPIPTPTPTPIVPSNPFLEYTQFIPSEKLIAVTFNDGPSNYTYKILDKLEGTDGHVTFFVTGERLEREDSERSKVTARGILAGHEYGFLSWANDGENSRYTNMTLEELQTEIANTNACLKKLGGKEVSVIRPVGGGRYMDTSADYGYPCILWSIDGRDWDYAGQAKKGTITNEEAAQKIYENIMNEVRPGAIVLMQDIYEVSAEAFAMLYDTLTEQGYKFVTVSEMLQIQGKNADGYTFYSTYHALYHGARCSN